MKVLFITHLRESTDWSETAIDYIMAMKEAGIDLVVRDVCVNPANRNAKVPMSIIPLEKKPIEGCEVCIQNVLPHLISYSDKFKKNIAMFSVEASSLKHSFWFKPLELMDEVWVNNNELARNLKDDGIAPEIKVIPPPSDTDWLSSSSKLFDDDDFKFYYVGEILDINNISSLIRCFHSEFSPDEPVSLVIHPTTNVPEENKQAIVDKISQEVKSKLRIYPTNEMYKKETVISQPLNRQGLLALHNSCDCFVSTSHGDSWSRHAFEAMAFGNTPIVGGSMGNVDFITSSLDTGVLVGGSYSVCSSTTPPFQDLQTGREVWFSVSESEFKSWMRNFYNKRDEVNRKDGLERAKDFSYKNIGSKIKEILA